MKLSNALSVLTDLQFAITVAILPTLKNVFHKPTLLFKPQALSRVFMAHLWVVVGDFADTKIKYQLITSNAYGSFLDVGAGDEGSDAWMEWKMYDYPDDDKETMFCHRSGKFVKI